MNEILIFKSHQLFFGIFTSEVQNISSSNQGEVIGQALRFSSDDQTHHRRAVRLKGADEAPRTYLLEDTIGIYRVSDIMPLPKVISDLNCPVMGAAQIDDAIFGDSLILIVDHQKLIHA